VRGGGWCQEPSTARNGHHVNHPPFKLPPIPLERLLEETCRPGGMRSAANVVVPPLPAAWPSRSQATYRLADAIAWQFGDGRVLRALRHCGLSTLPTLPDAELLHNRGADPRRGGEAMQSGIQGHRPFEPPFWTAWRRRPGGAVLSTASCFLGALKFSTASPCCCSSIC
jgi:hypothetical protein